MLMRSFGATRLYILLRATLSGIVVFLALVAEWVLWLPLMGAGVLGTHAGAILSDLPMVLRAGLAFGVAVVALWLWAWLRMRAEYLQMILDIHGAVQQLASRHSPGEGA
jgi:hypothetical protein